MDIELITILVIGVVLLLIFIWYVWNLTRPPVSLGPRWFVMTSDDKYRGLAAGNLWLDPENQELNYLVQIKGINGTIKRAYFRLPEEDPHTLVHPEGKIVNYYTRNEYLVIAGNWSYNDLHQPLTDQIISYLFNETLELVVILPNNLELNFYLMLDNFPRHS